MSVWGIACYLDRGEPVVVAVAATGSPDEPAGSEVFRYRTTEHEDWATKLWSLRAALDAKLRTERPEGVVVRSMDWPPVRPREAVIRPRLSVEGVLLEACRNHTTSVIAMSGRTIGEFCGSSKDIVDARSKAIFGRDLVEAGAAAIAALVRDQRGL